MTLFNDPIVQKTWLSRPSAKYIFGLGQAEMEIEVIYARAIANQLPVKDFNIRAARKVLCADEIIECLEFRLCADYEDLLKELGEAPWHSYATLMSLYESSITEMQSMMHLSSMLQDLKWQTITFLPTIYVLFCILKAKIFAFRFLNDIADIVAILFKNQYHMLGLIIAREIADFPPRSCAVWPKFIQTIVDCRDFVLQSPNEDLKKVFLEFLAKCGRLPLDLRKTLCKDMGRQYPRKEIIENIRVALQLEGPQWISCLAKAVMGFNPNLDPQKEEIMCQRIFLSSPGTMNTVMLSKRLPMLRVALCGSSGKSFEDLKLVSECYSCLFHKETFSDEMLPLFSTSLGQAVFLFALCSTSDLAILDRLLALLPKIVQSLSAESIVLLLESLSEEPYEELRSQLLSRLRDIFTQALGINLSSVVRENIAGCLFLINSRSMGTDGHWDRTDLEVFLGLAELLVPEDRKAAATEFSIGLKSKDFQLLDRQLLSDLEPFCDSEQCIASPDRCWSWLEEFCPFTEKTRFVTPKEYMAMALLYWCRTILGTSKPADSTFYQFYLQEISKFFAWDSLAMELDHGGQTNNLWVNLDTSFREFLRPFLSSRLSIASWQLYPECSSLDELQKFLVSLQSQMIPKELVYFHGAIVLLTSQMDLADMRNFFLTDSTCNYGSTSITSYATQLYFASKNQVCVQGKLCPDLNEIFATNPSDINLWSERLTSAKLESYAIRILDEQYCNDRASSFAKALKNLFRATGFADEADAFLDAEDLVGTESMQNHNNSLQVWDLASLDYFSFDYKKFYEAFSINQKPIVDDLIKDPSFGRFLKIADFFHLDIESAETLIFRHLRREDYPGGPQLESLLSWRDFVRSEWLRKYMSFLEMRDKVDPDKALTLLRHCCLIAPESLKPKLNRDIIDLVCFRNAFSESEKQEVFRQAMAANENDPKTTFLYAKYLLESAEHGQSKSRKYGSIKAFAKCFLISDRYDDVACPRFLNLWFELSRDSNADISEKVNAMASRVCRKVPASKFLACVSQILGELCQDSKATAPVLQHLVLRLFAAFPHSLMWKILNFVQSKKISRRSSFAFLSDAVKTLPEYVSIWQTYVEIGSFLTTICDAPRDKNQPCLLSRLCASSIPTFSEQKSPAAFPTSRVIYQSGSEVAETVFIWRFDDNFEVLPSLQKPKKITVWCSDGQARILLCKPRDDMRKDLRFLEVATTILQHAKRKRLSMKMKTYAAVPLNEDTGIVEWIDGMISLRSVLTTLYSELGISISYPSFRDAQKLPNARELFIDTITTRFPSRLHHWFYKNSTRPQQWLDMRNNYTNSTAFMSVLGHIMGLGDRHCENILLCKTDGSIFHVDFSCLLEKGKLLEVPELVPFRLTHNIVAAMGPAEWRGNFLTFASKYLATLKSFSGVILALLEPLIADPITDFETLRTGGGSTALEFIKKKLGGIEGDSKFLNDRGHMRYLISIATDPSHLCQMYVGWAPFL